MATLDEEWNSAAPTLEDEWNKAAPTKKTKGPIPIEQETVPGLIRRGMTNIPGSFANVVKGGVGMIAHPFQTAENIGGYVGKVGRAGLEQLVGEPVDPEAEAAVKTFAEPVRKAIEHPAGIPRMVGEYAAEHPVEAGLMVSGGLGATGSALRNIGVLPRTAEALTTAARVTNPFNLPIKGAEAVAGKVMGIPPTIEQAVTTGMEKGVKPSVKGKGTFPLAEKYRERSNIAVKDIVENKNTLQLMDETGNLVTGKVPENLKEFSQAVNEGKMRVFSESDALVKGAEKAGGRLDLAPIVKEIREGTKKVAMNDFNKPAIDYANSIADTLEKRGTYGFTDAQESIAMLNARLENFYANPNYAEGSKALVDSLVANNLRKGLDKAIEGLTGEKYQPLKDKYGAYKTIEKDVNNAATREARKPIKGLIDFSDVFTGYHFARGLIALNPSTIVAGGFAKSLSWLYRRWNDPNERIKAMFQNVEKGMAEKPPGYFDPGEVARRAGVGAIPAPEVQALPGAPLITPTAATPTPNLPIPYERGGMPAVAGPRVDISGKIPPERQIPERPIAFGERKEIPTPSSRGLLPGASGFTIREGGFTPSPKFEVPPRTYGPTEIGPGITTQPVERRAGLPFLPKDYYGEKPPAPKIPHVEGLKYGGITDLSSIGEPNQHTFTVTKAGAESSFSTSDISKENLITNRDRIIKNFSVEGKTWAKASPEEKSFWTAHLGDAETAENYYGAFKGDFSKAAPSASPRALDEWKAVKSPMGVIPTPATNTRGVLSGRDITETRVPPTGRGYTFTKELANARRALASGTSRSKVREMFKNRTGKEYPE